MVIVKLMGGLGNQMFQYATGRALALHHGQQLKVDTSFLEIDSKGAYTQRKYELDIFEALIQKLAPGELDEFLARRKKLARKVVNKIYPGFLKDIIFNEAEPVFQDDIWRTPHQVYLNGFWQCERYFKGIRETILNDFEIKSEYLAGVSDILSRIKNSNSVAIHVRRGDYVSSEKFNAFHGVCSVSYYQNAIQHLEKEQENLELFVFSDDLPWCRSNLNFALPVHFVDVGSPFKDLFLMRYCKHQIIANSSFSWWAAWLNRHEAKVVLAPKLWFKELGMQRNDIVPPNWIQL